MFRTFRTQFRTCSCEVDGCGGQLISMLFWSLGAGLVFELPMIAEYVYYDWCIVWLYGRSIDHHYITIRCDFPKWKNESTKQWTDVEKQKQAKAKRHTMF